MRTVRNITVSVSPEIYYQTRMLAVEYDTTVTELVRDLLSVMPRVLKSRQFPVGGRKQAPAPPPSTAPELAPEGGSHPESTLQIAPIQ
jgi:hypothetical protein